MFDLDKNTKDEIMAINTLLSKLSLGRLENDIREEAYEESLFIGFVVKYLSDLDELEALLEGNNQTVILSVLERLKALGLLADSHKQKALESVSNKNIQDIVNAL